jgi:hypothetical protein
MSTLAIEINDAGLTVANADGVLCVEPGYALVEAGRIVTGEPAFSQARLKPRQVSNCYWGALSATPGSAGLDTVGNAAQLAHAQLSALWRRFEADADDVVLAVPSYYGREQLGLLLGLAEECRMPVRAMVDAAAAASAKPYPSRQLVYVDAGLHRVSVIVLEQGAEVTAGEERGLDATGLASVNDTLARRLAEIFVSSTRFDPFHEAASEQRLYDLLPQCLARLRSDEAAELTLQHEGDAFTIEVEREQLLAVVNGFYRALLQLISSSRESGASLVVQLSERLAGLPGLTDALSRLDDATVVALDEGHTARAVLKGLDAIEAGNGPVKLLRHFAWRDVPAEDQTPRREMPAPREASDAETVAPTHVVYRGVAYRVDGEGIVVGRDNGGGRRAIVIEERSNGVSRTHCELVLRDGELRLRDRSRHGTFVNEKRVAGEQVLEPADVIRVGSPGAELQVVVVE